MKNKHYLILLCMIFAVNLTGNAQRHMKGVHHLQIEGGYFDSFENQPCHLGIYLSKVRSSKWWWSVGVDANMQQIEVAGTTFPIEKYFLGGSYFYTLGSLFDHGLYFNVGLGPLVGYEQVNNGNHLVNEAVSLKAKSKTVAGLRPEFNTEIFLSSKFILTVGYSKRAVLKSDISFWDDLYAIGLKFYIH